MLQKFQTSILLVDKESQVFKINIKNDSHLSFSGNYLGGCGQCQDHIIPADIYQEELIQLWNTYHLNGQSSGTPEQDTLIAQWKAQGNTYDYKEVCNYLQTVDKKGNEISFAAHQRFTKAFDQYKKQNTFESTFKKNVLKSMQRKEKGILFAISFADYDESFKDYIFKFFADTEDLQKEMWRTHSFKISSTESSMSIRWRSMYVNSISSYEDKKFLESMEKFISSYEFDFSKTSDDLYTTAYVVKHNNIPHQYGCGWIKKPIPEDLYNRILLLKTKIEKPIQGKKNYEIYLQEDSFYEAQAKEFLMLTETSIQIHEPKYGKHFPTDKESRWCYPLKLSNPKGSYSFKFGQSIAAGRQDPTPYSVLSCLTVMHSDSFEDFCGEFGYDTDSRQAFKTYEACLKESNALRKMFTEEELNMLSNIS